MAIIADARSLGVFSARPEGKERGEQGAGCRHRHADPRWASPPSWRPLEDEEVCDRDHSFNQPARLRHDRVELAGQRTVVRQCELKTEEAARVVLDHGGTASGQQRRRFLTMAYGARSACNKRRPGDKLCGSGGKPVQVRQAQSVIARGAQQKVNGVTPSLGAPAGAPT